MVAGRLADLALAPQQALLPVGIDLDRAEGCTRLRVTAPDTPAFLYALSTALALRGIGVERVSIATAGGRIEDEFDLTDASGGPIRDADALAQVRLSVLLTKQFTYFLGGAPDPYAALARFERLIGDVLKLPDEGRWRELLASPRALNDLARILGASDFMWEDFIRLQYATLLPVLEPHVEGRPFVDPPDRQAARLAVALAAAPAAADRQEALTAFRDREIFLIDLDHILSGTDLRLLAARLTALAELAVNAAVRLVTEELTRRLRARPTTWAPSWHAGRNGCTRPSSNSRIARQCRNGVHDG
ncbi:MAG: hypothetical protein ABIF71_04490 [Planctomycetota bacterium]